ncbi:metacaspase-9 [Corylus avellana]|uniref:metacaspase-9 n=1 Tax=Corylus avellana TaxID=13451 RepID=UPI001E21A920|nr:metacaspase-9 [Corylus avellana]
MEKSSGKKRAAVLVGCNYPNTPHELHGCINDVLGMREVLVKELGFEGRHIELLTDAPGSAVMPTGANIKKAVDRMVDAAQSGDVLFFHYSGHGTTIPSSKPGHPFRQDEAIVPCDFNLITDVDFREIVNRVPKGASFTIVSDSCHSGGLIDKEKEQIGPSCVTTKERRSTPKTIPFESILQHLTSLTSINTSDIGTHLLHFFGADASLKFRLRPHELDLLGDDEGILLSGCQANETSADIAGEKAYGAFSHALQRVLLEDDHDHDHVDVDVGRRPLISNRQLVLMTRKALQATNFAQHPCLYCSDQNADAPFLSHSI